VVWDCVYALLKQPEWVEEELSKQEANEHIDELRKRIGIEHQRIDRTQAKIRRIQEGYEADPPVYTTSEAEENTKVCRDLISQVEKEVYRLQEIMAQQTLNKKTKEAARHVLDTIRDMNLENASFSDKQNLVAKLGIKVYPSEDKKVVRISSIIQPHPCPFKFPSENQHGVAKAIETIPLGYSFLVGLMDNLFTGKGRNQHQQG
jgi:polyhydroxyalkanoate synthesis regulator phasin